MGKIKRFLEAMEESEFQEPYTKLEQKVVYERIKDLYCKELLEAILKAVRYRDLNLNVLEEIFVSKEKVRTGEVTIRISKKKKNHEPY